MCRKILKKLNITLNFYYFHHDGMIKKKYKSGTGLGCNKHKNIKSKQVKYAGINLKIQPNSANMRSKGTIKVLILTIIRNSCKDNNI